MKGLLLLTPLLLCLLSHPLWAHTNCDEALVDLTYQDLGGDAEDEEFENEEAPQLQRQTSDEIVSEGIKINESYRSLRSIADQILGRTIDDYSEFMVELERKRDLATGEEKVHLNALVGEISKLQTRIVEINKPLLYHMADGQTNPWFEGIEDLVSVGREGLVRALHTYNGTIPFKNFLALCVRWKIQRWLQTRHLQPLSFDLGTVSLDWDYDGSSNSAHEMGSLALEVAEESPAFDERIQEEVRDFRLLWLKKFMRSLGLYQRTIFKMYYLENRPADEIYAAAKKLNPALKNPRSVYQFKTNFLKQLNRFLRKNIHGFRPTNNMAYFRYEGERTQSKPASRARKRKKAQ